MHSAQKKLRLRTLALAAAALLTGCATSYRFTSTPEGAAVYQQTGTQKLLLGETPIDFTKTMLPADGPFVVVFEKSGYDPREVAVTPTDNSLTTIAVQLKPKEPGGPDEGLKRSRAIVRQIFAVQDQIRRKRYVEALAGLKALEASEPRLPELYVIRGSVYSLIDDPEGARTAWEKALELDPSLEELKLHLAKLPERGKVP